MAQIRTKLDERLSAYLLANGPPEHDELRNLREATKSVAKAHMQILPEQGHFLALLIKLIGARRVLELGTFTGYSAMAMALALPADGRLVTCDLNEDSIEFGHSYWARAGVAERIKVMIGPALESLAQLENTRTQFDVIFIDADKIAYDHYYESALRLVRPGGLIVFDNMLQRDEVAELSNGDPRTASVRSLNAKIAGDERVDRVILPIADGMTLARRRT
jgi:predicted O-methyltransferase YrrM